jgi:hypothetical protein
VLYHIGASLKDLGKKWFAFLQNRHIDTCTATEADRTLHLTWATIVDGNIKHIANTQYRFPATLNDCSPLFPFFSSSGIYTRKRNLMSVEENTPVVLQIEQKIFNIRGMQVMLDSDLAELYGVETKRLNEQVRRNSNRFPITFRFQLTTSEKMELVAKCDRLDRMKHSSVNPYAFSEHGVAMLSSILRSQIAVDISIRIIEAFVQLRRLLEYETPIVDRIKKLELFQDVSYGKFDQIFKALETRKNLPETGIFFEGEVFDAWVFISDLVRSAKLSILLIDNFVDDTVLNLYRQAERKRRT